MLRRPPCKVGLDHEALLVEELARRTMALGFNIMKPVVQGKAGLSAFLLGMWGFPEEEAAELSLHNK